MPCKFTDFESVNCNSHCPLCGDQFDGIWDNEPCTVQEGELVEVCSDCGAEAEPA